MISEDIQLLYTEMARPSGRETESLVLSLPPREDISTFYDRFSVCKSTEPGEDKERLVRKD